MHIDVVVESTPQRAIGPIHRNLGVDAVILILGLDRPVVGDRVFNTRTSKRCLIPIDGYFEWRDIHGTGKDKQPYAIAMKDGSPFALAGIFDIWRNPATGELVQTFCVVTCPPNELMATIHDRMPVILAPADYARWIGPELDPDLTKPFPSDLMTMWKIGRKVGVAEKRHARYSRSD